MAKQIFRDKSLERISSPEQLNDYLKVTKPAVWIVLIGVIVLLAGVFIWGAFTYIGSKKNVKANVLDGNMTVFLDNEGIPSADAYDDWVINVGGESFSVKSADDGKDGVLSVTADTDLEDGTYNAVLEYKKTQILSLLFDVN